jgi:hypothetical protein
LLRNGQNARASSFTEFIDCAFEALHDHIDKFDWICRDVWNSRGLTTTAEFIREVLSPRVANEIEACAAELERKLKEIMRRKRFKDRTAILHHFENTKAQFTTKISNQYEIENVRFPLDQEVKKSGDLKVANPVMDGHRSGHPSVQTDAVSANSTDGNPVNAIPNNFREVFVRPILQERGLSIHDWATNADVDFHTADNYIKGKTKPYPATRKKLAGALGIAVEKLPG